MDEVESVDELLWQLERAIENIDEVGSDAPLWENKAVGLARRLADRARKSDGSGS